MLPPLLQKFLNDQDFRGPATLTAVDLCGNACAIYVEAYDATDAFSYAAETDGVEYVTAVQRLTEEAV